MRVINATVLALALVLVPQIGCVGGGDDDDSAADGGGGGTYELYVNSDYLGVLQLTFLKGRCVSRMSIDSQDAGAEAALLAFGEHVADQIPLDGSAPADDTALSALVPADPLTGDLADWEASEGGAWLVTTNAFDWINGSGPPFDDNGFEAVAGDSYTHTTQTWLLDLELVNMGDVAGAEAAFRGAGWDSGTQHE
jgi:hypothetical protein